MRMIVLVGPPAAGKSTYVQKNFADIEHRLISTDAILEDYAALDGIT